MGFVRKFYTSDTHFGHVGIIDMCQRPFKSVAHMDNEMVQRWNACVGAQDIVYHLGDFSMDLRDADRVKRIFSLLNGKKYLILGNHDVDRDGAIHPTIATLDWAARPEWMMMTRDGGEDVILAHYAQREWQRKFDGAWHFYGHSHNRLPGVGRSRDVGVDCLDTAFCPMDFRALTQKIRDDEKLNGVVVGGAE